MVSRWQINGKIKKCLLHGSPSSSSFFTTGGGFRFLSVAFILVKRSLSNSACVFPGSPSAASLWPSSSLI